MPNIPDDAVAQLGELPIVVAVLLIAIVGLVAIVWITWKQGRDERSAFLSFFGQQRDLDRALGKQTSETDAGAIAQLADAIRDNGTATLTLIQGVMDKVDGISDKVDEAMNANTDAIRFSNHQIATMARDVDEILRRNHDDEPDKKARR